MDKNSYALGMSIAHNMLSSGIKEVDFEDFTAGIKAVLTGEEPAVSFQEAGKLLDKYFADIEAEQKAEKEAMGAYVGNICMDVCMIDVTDIDCKEGDSVEIFGDHLPITVLSDALDTIPYEVLTSISTRVKRVYYQD